MNSVTTGYVADIIKIEVPYEITWKDYHIIPNRPFYQWIPGTGDCSIEFYEWNDPEGFESYEKAMEYEEEYRKRLERNGDILFKKINEALHFAIM